MLIICYLVWKEQGISPLLWFVSGFTFWEAVLAVKKLFTHKLITIEQHDSK